MRFDNLTQYGLTTLSESTTPKPKNKANNKKMNCQKSKKKPAKSSNI